MRHLNGNIQELLELAADNQNARDIENVGEPNDEMGVHSAGIDQSSSALTGILKASSPKSSHQGFLNWVAYTRNLHATLHEIERRTCPLIDCEKVFISTDSMLMHVKKCLRLSHGFYRCFESNKKERVGRCPTPGCRELQQTTKARVATAFNSLKRRLSPRHHRPRPLAPKSEEKQSISPEMSVASTESDGSYPAGIAELSYHDARISVPEMDEICVPVTRFELSTVCSAFGHSIHAQGDITTGSPLSSNLPIIYQNASHSDTLQEPYRQLPVELDARDEPSELPTQTGKMLPQPEYLDVGGMPPKIQPLGHRDRLESISNTTTSHSLTSSQVSTEYSWLKGNLQRSGILHAEQDTQSHEYTNDPAEYDSFNMPVPVSPVSPMGSGTSSDGLWGAWDSATAWSASGLSSANTSMSSFELGQCPSKLYEDNPNRFFDEPSLMFNEPETIQPLSPKVAHIAALDDMIDYETLNPADIESANIHPFTHQRAPSITNIEYHYQAYRPPAFSSYQVHREYIIPPSLPFSKPRIRHNPPIAEDSGSLQSHQSLKRSNPYRDSQPAHLCNYCGRWFKDRSNVKRHERTTCSSSDKPYKCTYSQCTASYTRSDNLANHRRVKKHD